ncbi:MAG: ethylbenzene dehydrogenase [Acidobacteria bacterium]|nr:MAG: ethylbenzene dehydrogenase [Acidobacteriota bacterium]
MSTTAETNETKVYRGWEDLYRDNWEWDKVVWGTHCVDCYPGNCPFRVYVKNGIIWREEQSGSFETVEEGVPDFNPMGCQKGAAWSQQLYSPDRLMYPIKRVGERGSGKWKRITWDEALTEIADAVIDACEEEGPETIVHEGTPEMQTVIPTHRFIGTIGGTILDLQGSINDFSTGLHISFGKFNPVSSADDWFNSELVLIWHMNPIFTRIPFYHFIAEARYNGAEVWNIAPDVNQSHTHADYFVPVKGATDAALALAAVQVIIEEGIADYTFIREQTDLPLLVRKDNNMYLRQTDLEEGVDGIRDDQMYHWLDGAPVKADRGHLLLEGKEVELEGTFTVTLKDGREVEVTPVFQMLKDHLNAEYTPELQEPITGVNPDVVRKLARTAAAKKTNIMLGWNSCKYFHGDLMERAMCLLLGVTGNWGKKGTGIRSWSAGMFDGNVLAMGKAAPGLQAAENMLNGLEMMRAALKQTDPTMTDEIIMREMGRNRNLSRMGSASETGGGMGGNMVPPVFWWYWQAGYKERWNNKEWNDPTMKRSFDDYVQESLDKGWWEGVNEAVRPDKHPRVLIECGSNMLRRTRGGQTQLLPNLWEKLKLIVSIDFRLNTTGLHSDIVLPAAQHYEKLGFHIPTPHVLNLTFSDKAAEPAGEAKAEFQIFSELMAKIGERAKERGLDVFKDHRGASRKYENLYDIYTLDGYFLDEDRMYDEMVRDSALVGTIPDNTNLDTMREKGHVRFIDWGFMPMALAQASPLLPDETHSPFRDHVEDGTPFPTYARRAQFYIDHPWYIEAGEALPVHKDNPNFGGTYPMRMTSGHNRWSIHGMNMSNWVILQTHRGEPHAEVNDKDAEARGVQDGDLIRVFNDISSFTVKAKVSPCVRPNQVVSYNGWEGYQYENWRGANETEAGLVKYLQLAGGYGHLNFMSTEWQPVPTDRGVPVDFEKA